MRNIVIIEDNVDLRASLIDILSSASTNVVGFESSEAFLTGCSLQAVNIVLLDLNLPGEDGIALAKRLKKEAPHIGIIMLTARRSAEEVGAGYSSGADIYLIKPSSASELKGAIEALLRRTASLKATEQKIELDMRSMTVSGPDGVVNISDTDAELLKKFILAPDNRLEKEVIAETLCVDDDAKPGTLEVRIVRLRKKLVSAGAKGKTINVVRGWGYQLATTIVMP
jgi:DNA-binding response OmpR family regulator